MADQPVDVEPGVRTSLVSPTAAEPEAIPDETTVYEDVELEDSIGELVVICE